MASWEYTFRGLTFGGAQSIGVDSIDGLEPPATKLDNISRAKDHGSFAYGDTIEERLFTLGGDLIGTSDADFEGRVNSWRAAFGKALVVPAPLVLNLPGDVRKHINCIPVRRSLRVDRAYSYHYALWSVQFLAEDPRFYDDVTEKSLTTFPGTAANDGTFETWPSAVITGSTTNPKITNNTTGEFIEITGTFAGGLIIDFAGRLIHEGTTSRYSALTATSTWWDLEPGDNSILFSGGGSLELTWRDAWI